MTQEEKEYIPEELQGDKLGRKLRNVLDRAKLIKMYVLTRES